MSLSKGTTKQAYRFLDKHFYKKAKLRYELAHFACEKIGLCQDRDLGRLKSKTRRLLQELVDIGFIESPEFEKAGKLWYITLRRNGQVPRKGMTQNHAQTKGSVVAVTDSEDCEMVKRMDRQIKAHFGPLNPKAYQVEEERAFSRWEKENPQLVTQLHDWMQRGGKAFETLKREILYEYTAKPASRRVKPSAVPERA